MQRERLEVREEMVRQVLPPLVRVVQALYPVETAETVEQEVEVIEHHLKPETLRVFSKLVRFWHEHPQHLETFLRYGKGK